MRLKMNEQEYLKEVGASEYYGAVNRETLSVCSASAVMQLLCLKLSQRLLFQLFDIHLFQSGLDHRSAANLLFYLRNYMEEMHWVHVSRKVDCRWQRTPYNFY